MIPAYSSAAARKPLYLRLSAGSFALTYYVWWVCSAMPVSSEHRGEQHACERHHWMWWLVRSETRDGGSLAVRTARPTEKNGSPY
jgi:hypothetical protein